MALERSGAFRLGASGLFVLVLGDGCGEFGAVPQARLGVVLEVGFHGATSYHGD
jgi:hypothetical protein